MKKNENLPSFRKKKMKKKFIRRIIYVSPILSLFCLITALYMVSYYGQKEESEETHGTLIQAGSREKEQEKAQENEQDKERDNAARVDQENDAETNINALVKETRTEFQVMEQEGEKILAADDNTDIYITPRMTYTLEIYDARADQVSTEQPPIPNDMYGLNRVELEQYLVQLSEMENEEMVETQSHYQVVAFSRRGFTVRKTITENEVTYAIFLIAEDGFLTAYTGDLMSVYEYTHIAVTDFPLEQQRMLQQGIYMKTMTDYYDFLETYSS